MEPQTIAALGLLLPIMSVLVVASYYHGSVKGYKEGLASGQELHNEWVEKYKKTTFDVIERLNGDVDRIKTELDDGGFVIVDNEIKEIMKIKTK